MGIVGETPGSLLHAVWPVVAVISSCRGIRRDGRPRKRAWGKDSQRPFGINRRSTCLLSDTILIDRVPKPGHGTHMPMPQMPSDDRKEVLRSLRCAPSLKALFNAMQRVDPPLTDAEYIAHIRGIAHRLRFKRSVRDSVW